MQNRSGQLKLVENKAVYGGSHWDSFTHAAMFKSMKPFDFGVKEAKLFATQRGTYMVNRSMVDKTIASGNVFVLPAGTTEYQWTLASEPETFALITHVDANLGTTPGKNGLEFYIYLNRGDYHVPSILKTEDLHAPMMRIVGHPVQTADMGYRYKLTVQSGDTNDYVDPAFLQVDMRIFDATTSVSDELNQEYSAISMVANTLKLQSHIGNFARKLEFTDKFIRLELAGKKASGARMSGIGAYDGNILKNGYTYVQTFGDPKTGKKFEQDVFISAGEAALLDRLYEDMEMNMRFGRAEITTDPETGRPIKVAPGWYQLVRDGWYLPHNGSLDLDTLYEWLYDIFFQRRGFESRKIVLETGEGGYMWLHEMIKEKFDNVTGVIFNQDLYLEKANSEASRNAYTFKVPQFTGIVLPNGVEIEVRRDPRKDDKNTFPQLAPNSRFTIESFCIDIFDMGTTDQTIDSKVSANVAWVQEDMTEEYYTVTGVYNFETGAINNGANAGTNSKELGIYRAKSGGLVVWDVTRTGRIEYVPNMCLTGDC